MSKYKLVPVELLSELAESLASELDARYPASVRSYESQDRKYQSEMEPVITARQIIADAPDVHGDPVGWVNSDELDNMLDDRTATLFPVRTGFHGKPVYAAPQPAEQQSDRDVRMLAASLYQACGAYDMPTRVLDALSAAENGEPFAHMIDGLLPCVPPSDQDVQGDPVGAEQQPDVIQLVEALDMTELRKLLLILRGNIGGAMWTLDDEEEELAVRTEKAIEAIDALAAHRKGGAKP